MITPRFFCNDTATTEIYTLSLHDALPISMKEVFGPGGFLEKCMKGGFDRSVVSSDYEYRAGQLEMAEVVHDRSEEHTSELQSRLHLVCRLLLEKKKTRRSLE